MSSKREPEVDPRSHSPQMQLEKAVAEFNEQFEFEVDNIARCFRVNHADLLSAWFELLEKRILSG